MNLFDFKKVPVKTRLIGTLVYSFLTTLLCYILYISFDIADYGITYYAMFFSGLFVLGFFLIGFFIRPKK